MHATETSLHGEQQWPEISTHTEKRESSEIDFCSSKRHDLFSVLPDGAKEGLSLLSQPSLVLCWAESSLHPTHTLGLLWFVAPQRLGGIGLSRGEFCFSLLTHLSNSSAHWDGKSSALEGSRKQNCSRVSITSVSHRCTEGWRHEPENTSKVENSFIWFCLVGIGRMEEWELGILLLLCPWNRAPSLLRSCSCGVALRTGSNTPSHSML